MLLNYLFIYGLFNDAVSSSGYMTSNGGMIDLKGYGRKRSWHNLRQAYYPDIGVVEVRKATKYLSQNSQSPGRDLNRDPPEYEVGVVTTRLRS
jgi:hypothetical protein